MGGLQGFLDLRSASIELDLDLELSGWTWISKCRLDLDYQVLLVLLISTSVTSHLRGQCLIYAVFSGLLRLEI